MGFRPFLTLLALLVSAASSDVCFQGASPDASFVFGDKCYWLSLPTSTVRLQVGPNAGQTHEFGKDGQWIQLPETDEPREPYSHFWPIFPNPPKREWLWFNRYLDAGLAASRCKDLGGAMAMPKTKAINDFLTGVLRGLKSGLRPDDKAFYIGLEASQRKFIWQDGTPATFTNFDRELTDDHYYMYAFALDPLKEGLWRPVRRRFEGGRDFNQNYICEFPATSQSIPSTGDME